MASDKQRLAALEERLEEMDERVIGVGLCAYTVANCLETRAARRKVIVSLDVIIDGFRRTNEMSGAITEMERMRKALAIALDVPQRSARRKRSSS